MRIIVVSIAAADVCVCVWRMYLYCVWHLESKMSQLKWRIVFLIALQSCLFSFAKTCKNSDLLEKAESKALQPTGKKSWAIVCLLRSSNRIEYSRRNKALAAALLPFASKHDFNILMFSEDSFPKSEVWCAAQVFRVLLILYVLQG